MSANALHNSAPPEQGLAKIHGLLQPVVVFFSLGLVLAHLRVAVGRRLVKPSKISTMHYVTTWFEQIRIAAVSSSERLARAIILLPFLL